MVMVYDKKSRAYFHIIFSEQYMKTESPEAKRINCILLLCRAAFMIFFSAFADEVRAVEEPYSIISKKNLFHPERKEWIMEKTDSKANEAKKAVPKIDLKQIKLMGTVIIGNERKAVIKNSLKK